MPSIEYYGLLFEWNDDKAELVFMNRGFTLTEVASVFFDDFETTYEDSRNYYETRFCTVGLSNQVRLLTVVWTQRGDTIRIITAFKSSKPQERRYQNDKQIGF
jgi:uncharacterized DUF497 family protein